MPYSRMLETARQDFDRLSPGRNVFVLHPQFRYHNALIDALLLWLDRDVLYVTLGKPAFSLAGLWQQMQTELEQTYGVVLPGLDGANPTEAAVKFEKAVGTLTPLVIVLFAYDHAQQSVHDFVAFTAARLGDRGCFVLDSRIWPQPLIDRIDSTSRLAVMPVSPDDMLLDYFAHEQARVMLEVRALGSGQVLINGRLIDQWDGALPRSLFFYFIDRGMTTRDEVFATFWPELSTREATNVFHVTKRKISEILEVDLTVYSSGFYRISPRIDLHYDVVSFAEAVQNSAVAEPDEAEFLLKRAIDLYERDFLFDFDQPWAIRRRNELRLTYVDALTALARLYEDESQSTEALGLYNRAFGAYPQREDLARSQMRLYRRAGQPDRALAVYDRLVGELEASLGVEPSPETRLLADEVRQSVSG